LVPSPSGAHFFIWYIFYLCSPSFPTQLSSSCPLNQMILGYEAK
jgi:hypothetical protein